MIVKIKRIGAHTFWYAGMLGQTFDVQPSTTYSSYFEVVTDPGYYILKDDAVVFDPRDLADSSHKKKLNEIIEEVKVIINDELSARKVRKAGDAILNQLKKYL